MKRGRIIIPVLVMFLLSLQGCDKLIDSWDENSNRNAIHGSGNLVNLELDYAGFDKLSLSHTFNATVTKGENYSVTVSVDDNIEEYVEVYQIADKIYFGLDSENNYNEVTLNVDIVMPDVEVLQLSGATYAKLEGFSYDHPLSLELSGASSVNGNINTGDLHAQLSGASSIHLTGSGDIVDISLSGASYTDLVNFIGTNGYAALSGASSAKVNVTETLQVGLSGTSILWYAGDPELNVIAMSGLSKLIRM
jgi:hypothetical protein